MSMGGIRVNVSNDHFLGDNDHDANSFLTELDKGLRSTKAGEQCEAVVRFTRLFQKYPFPILINSSLLKLSEFFRTSSNLVRLWVLKVLEQSDNHLDKISNIDEFVKRIFVVMHSNDPVARALSLRTLGAVARIIPEKQQVHHSIRRSLDSHDTVEVEAAIQASAQFAAQSKTFAIGMCSKIGSMIESLKTPVGMKLQLIPVLHHMHHDANTAALVKTLCINLLPKYPAESFTIAILDSLTKLSGKTLIDIPDQVNLLLNHLKDPRTKVRNQVLRSLITLAKEGAHLWPKGALRSLITEAKSSDEVNEKILVLTVVLTLTECPVTCQTLLNDEQTLLLEFCSTCLALEHHTAASQALAILTGLILYSNTERVSTPPIFMDLINLNLESLIFTTIGKENFTKELKKYLICGVKLSRINLEFSKDFVEMICDLFCDEVVYPSKHSVLLCETLSALCSQFQVKRFSKPESHPDCMIIDVESPASASETKNPVTEKLPQLLKKLESIFCISDTQENKCLIIEILSAVILQSIIGCFMPKAILECFGRTLETANAWTQYRIARSASRYGQHFLAAKIFSTISNNTSLDKFHFFLEGLAQMSKAECILNYGLEYDDMCTHYNRCDPLNMRSQLNLIPLIERLDKAINYYWNVLANLRASTSPNCQLLFQLEFIKLRAQFLQVIFSTVTAKNAQTIVPPPAIASSLAQNSRDYLQKYGHVTNQLRKVVKSIKACEDSYSRLYKSSFDADPATLEFLETTEYQCALFGNIIENVSFACPSEPPSSLQDARYPETKFLNFTCNKMETLAKNLPQESTNTKTITNRHMDVIINEIELITKSPICIPRYFYQVLQSTHIKLSISPQPRVPGEPIIVQAGSNLVIKVEGVIQHYGKCRSLYRTVESVQLSLTSQLITPRVNIDMKQCNDTVTLTQTVKPHRDFITGSFLIPLNNSQIGPMGTPISIGGQWQVTLETFVIDEQGNNWCSGLKSTMIVRVPDDPLKQGPVAGASNQVRRF